MSEVVLVQKSRELAFGSGITSYSAGPVQISC